MIRQGQEESGVSITDVELTAITNDFFETHGKHYATIWMEGSHMSDVII